jgi:tRNA1Val (adenine37-N6)-methyltransferase
LLEILLRVFGCEKGSQSKEHVIYSMCDPPSPSPRRNGPVTRSPRDPWASQLAGKPIQTTPVMTAEADLERVSLTRRFLLWQRVRGHRSATDDIVCAYAGHSARPRAGTILDLGAGQGAVTLMLAGAIPGAALTAIEVQELSYRLLERNIAENGLGARITAVHGDLRTIDLGDLRAARFDLVTGSPPYVEPGRGTLPRDAQRAAARFELRGGIEAYCAAAARWLAPDGRAVFLMNGGQDERSQRAAREVGLVPERRLAVHPHPGGAPRFVVYTLARVPLDEHLRESSLTIRDEHGRWSDAFATVRQALDLPGAAAE